MTFKNQDGFLPPNIFKLRESNHEFYVTGSRFFGTEHFFSDWDFFVQDSYEVRQFLDSIGFRRMSITETGYSEDSTIVEVWNSFDSQFYEDDRDNEVQVQLVKNAELKNKVQWALFKQYGKEFTKDKSEAKKLWDLALGIAEAFA